MQGHLLKQWRIDNGLNLEAAAKRLGTSKPTVSRIENGKRSPSLSLAAKLSERTGIAIDKFVRAS